ncbi:Regulator of drug sensitivity 2 [Colletotrichum chlorophyti]|uniref:Regulator of drug sensitivity 2 n=1 Tax=Colletotrichum chlorophyti TaxID=708187 RepID=A0A1Q8S1C0_9PEZI|nr:Regulator of drug sensitivity 2 [Colletotrichum chlorophyti]
MDKNGKDVKSEDDKDKREKPENNGAHDRPVKSPKKRRKVNHACVYCRRSERPCTRCIKRNIGHLCHDEPRDPDSKKAKSTHAASTVDDSETAPTELARGSVDQSAAGSMGPPPPFDRKPSAFGAAVLGQGNPLHLVSPGSVSGMPGNGSNMNQFAGFSDAWLTAQNHYHDMQNYHPNYMIAPEVTHEFNLLNDFLQTSLLDDGGILSDESQNSPAFSRTAGANDMLPTFGNLNNGRAANNSLSQMLPPQNLEQGKAISRPGSVVQADKDKAREYYLQAADPSGNDTPEERMDRVLKAKYEAGLLKPFNYVKGYARLGTYLDSHIAPSSKQKILRTIDRFRPKFREKAQALTDMELLYVEMWFEKQLMEYDRVFASMAVPACCWRRTGEIFRGNNEMAELLHVPVENLRDGKISLHEILTEESLVRYWEEFGTIAFDPSHDTLLTACTLKNPDDKATDPVVNCCFSFMIQRDNHKINSFRAVDEAELMSGFYGVERLVSSNLKNDVADKIASFTCFAQTLLRRIPSASDPPAIDTLLEELKHQLQAVGGFHASAKAKPHRNELDRKATELWNLCTRLRREDLPAATPTRKKLMLRSRALAFFMIDVARGGVAAAKTQLADVVHLMKLALKTGKTCLDDDNTRLASLVFQKAAAYNAALGKMQEEMLGPDDLAECKRLEVEYFIMRTALSWKENSMETAEFMYGKGTHQLGSLDPSSAEKMAEVLFEIGKSLSKKNDFPLAVRWLERAYEVINGQDLDLLSRDAIELRLAVCQALIHALLGMDTQGHTQQAHNMVDYLQSEMGEKPVVLLLRLELLQKAPSEVFDVDAYAEVLRRMVRAFNASEAQFKLLIHHARKLHDKSPTLAANVVDGMLAGTVASLGRDESVERLVLLRIWMETSQRDSVEAVDELSSVLTGLQANTLTKPFGGSAAVGALTLVWKKIEVNYNQGHFVIAEGWKLILCALGRNDTERARQVFSNMAEAAQNEPITRYLMYKVALRSSDRELATECLERIGVVAPQDPNFLYACVLEAQQVNDRVCAMLAMKKLVERHESSEASPVHLPALLRCSIRLAVSAEENEKQAVEIKAAVEEITVLFEKAAKAIERDPKDKDGKRFFTVKELDWFCQNAYNLALKHSDSWDLKQLVRMFDSCLAIAKRYPTDLPAEAASDLTFRTMFCNFVAAAALVSLARAEDNVELQLQHYLVLRRHVEAYDNALQARLAGLDPRLADDLTAKLATLLVFDFEAAMALHDYQALGYIIRTARTCRDVDALKAMGDIALRGKLPGQGERVVASKVQSTVC